MKTLTVLFLALFTVFAHADIFDEGWTSVRALGMGNAYTAVVEDGDALFYNPANLALVSGFNWTIADPKIGVSGVEAYAKITDVQNSSSYVETLKKMYGESVWAGGSAKSAFFMPYFAFGVYDNLDASLILNNPAYPKLNANVVNDFGYALGFAIPVIPKIASVGFTTKRITRTGGRLPLGPSFIGTLDPDTIRSEIERKGSGYSLDAGLTMAFETPVFSPRVSLVWKNMGVTKFRNDGTTEAPTGDRDEMILGLASEFSLPLIDVRPALDIRGLNRGDVQLGKRLNFGVEVDLPFLDLRAGFHQGYLSYGVGLSFGLLEVEVASYGVELGEYPGQLEDRRYLLQITLELGFDPGFNLLSGKSSSGKVSSSKARGLKQRR